MKVFTCTCFRGHWPVGTSAIVTADNKLAASRLLENELMSIGLTQEIKPEWMVEIDTESVKAVVLQDGSY